MRMIEAHAVVGTDGTLTLQMPSEIAPGKYYVQVRMSSTPLDENSAHRTELSITIGRCTTRVTSIKDGRITTFSFEWSFPTLLSGKLIDYIKSQFGLEIGHFTAESIILVIGSAGQLDTELALKIQGRDLVVGLPKTIEISSVDVRRAIGDDIERFVHDILFHIEHNISKELTADFDDWHIVLRGEFGNLRKLDQRLREATGLPVRVEE